MNYKYYCFYFLFLMLVSCKKNTPIKVTSVSEKYTDTCKTDSCTEISIDYIKVQGKTLVSETINKKIEAFVVQSLLYEEENVKQIEKFTIPEAANYFIENYKKDKMEFPDITSAYSAEISVSSSFTSKKLLCYEMQQYLFTGGAHGFGSIAFLNINPESGKTMFLKDFCENEKEFKSFVEQKFREEMKIPSNKPINETGFWFENNTFYLPENIGFSKEDVIILYNTYEIASYATGPIELRISLKEVRPFLSIN